MFILVGRHTENFPDFWRYLPKSLEKPLYKRVSEREVCFGYLPYTSLDTSPEILGRSEGGVREV